MYLNYFTVIAESIVTIKMDNNDVRRKNHDFTNIKRVFF